VFYLEKIFLARISVQKLVGEKMKRSKSELDKKIKSITIDLLAWAGLKNAKKIVVAIRRNLKAEENRRKELKK